MVGTKDVGGERDFEVTRGYAYYVFTLLFLCMPLITSTGW